MLLAAALQMLAKAGLSLLPTAVSCEQGEYFQPKHGKHCQDVGLALGDFPVTIFFHAVSSMLPTRRGSFSAWIAGLLMALCAGPRLRQAARARKQPRYRCHLGCILLSRRQRYRCPQGGVPGMKVAVHQQGDFLRNDEFLLPGKCSRSRAFPTFSKV